MKSKIIIIAGVLAFEVEPHLFNGGELNIQLPDQFGFYDRIEIIANIADAEGIMTLALVQDAIQRLAPTAVALYLGYVPYARQDRICNVGESLAIKVFCNMINAMEFDEVIILDPHSDVTPALLDNCLIRNPEDILERPLHLQNLLTFKKVSLVAPDAGATKKVEKVSQHFGGLEIIQGMKKRDVKTGKLSGFEYYGDVEGKDLLIVDDICDGGGTFIGLAKELLKGGANTLSLYVSHGIFSKGLYELDEHFDKIYTTDSFDSGYEDDRLEIINWI